MRKGFAILAVVAWMMVVAPRAARAWNATGHRATALIAYRQLDEATRHKVAELLRKNPAAHDLWDERAINGATDDDANAFLNASTFADDVRPPSKFSRDYNRPTHHYVNFRYTPGDAAPLRDPVPGDDETILTSYQKNLATIKDADASAEDKAVALCWIFHQAGDIHQPLHAIARFSPAFPDGDRGGNLVKPFPNPRAANPNRPGDRDHNLHAYWDGILAGDKRVGDFGTLSETVDVLVSEFPRDTFTDAERQEGDIVAWARESADAAIKVVYRDLDPMLTGFADLPVAYEADAQRLGRRRIALAGYRLAEVLKGLFGVGADD